MYHAQAQTAPRTGATAIALLTAESFNIGSMRQRLQGLEYKLDFGSYPKKSYDFSPGGYSKLYPIIVQSLNSIVP
ncbi:hypothetical protein J0895_10135 [Phormidium pseudopriestleyi FRX01]|uniref:Uncharacterized protein n=1 Tax=Phormidium pseudopriestleyi FRX01 TaxID=1759528 RepID=A0ABS3FQQ9_9CYAN|nr:hypothetical protein [Phormidium pseudopriestleyi]MBO0349459.1 hypothetical protein [Phormidium pseudopriestleyi FRX01]